MPPSRWQAGVPLRPGDDLPEVPAQGAGEALRVGRGAGGRPGAVSARRADPARPVGRLERGVKWVKRNPLVAGAALAVVLALLIGIGLSTWQAVRATQASSAARSPRPGRT